MAFLAGLAAQLLEWLVQKLWAGLAVWIAQKRADKAITDQAQKDADALRAAKERDDEAKAVQDVIDHTFQ